MFSLSQLLQWNPFWIDQKTEVNGFEVRGGDLWFETQSLPCRAPKGHHWHALPSDSFHLSQRKKHRWVNGKERRRKNALHHATVGHEQKHGAVQGEEEHASDPGRRTAGQPPVRSAGFCTSLGGVRMSSGCLRFRQSLLRWTKQKLHLICIRPPSSRRPKRGPFPTSLPTLIPGSTRAKSGTAFTPPTTETGKPRTPHR